MTKFCQHHILSDRSDPRREHSCDMAYFLVDRLCDRATQALETDTRPQGRDFLGSGYSECGLDVVEWDLGNISL